MKYIKTNKWKHTKRYDSNWENMLNYRGDSSWWKYEWKSLEMIWSNAVNIAISWKSEVF